jgi:hypothetical protein
MIERIVDAGSVDERRLVLRKPALGASSLSERRFDFLPAGRIRRLV